MREVRVRLKVMLLIALFSIQCDAFTEKSASEHSWQNEQSKNEDAEFISTLILSLPVWSELEKGDVKKIEGRILEKLDLISNNNILSIREAIKKLVEKYPYETSVWSQIFLLNRYLFRVPEDSPIDDRLF